MIKEKQNTSLPHPVFLSLFIVFCLGSVLILTLLSRSEIVLWVNSLSSMQLDPVFIYITFFGHGTFALIISLIFLFKKLYHATLLGISFLLVSLFTNLLKHFVFIQYNRPLWSIYYDDLSRVIYEAPVNYLRSFPSGHTMTAFALAAVISMIYKSKTVVVVVFLYALLIAFSRIYLLQHFFVDVFWGSIFGVLAAILGKMLIDKLMGLTDIDFMQLSLQKCIRNVFTQNKQ